MSRASSPSLPLYNAAPSLFIPRPSSSRPTTPIPRDPTSSSITSTYSLLQPQETADRLDTSLNAGLHPSEAQSRLLKDGPNELPHEEPEPLWLRFFKQFQETLILLLLGSAAISFFMGNLDDAVSITIAVTIVVTVGFVQEYRSEKSLEALNRLVPHFAHLRREGGRPGALSFARTNGDTTELQPVTKDLADKLSSTVPSSAACRWRSCSILDW